MSLRTSRRRRRAHRTSGPRVLALLGVAGALAAAINAVTKRRSASAGSPADSGARPDAGAPPSQEPAADVVEQTYTCECGQEYRVAGDDRHRVYWRKDAEVSDPVLGQECPECDRPLPHDHPSAAA